MQLRRIITFIIILNFAELWSQQGDGWRYFGPHVLNEQAKGMVKALWVDQNNRDFMLVGSACGGLFRSENATSKEPIWINISDSFKGIVSGVSDIVVVPNSENRIIYIATGHKNTLSKAYGTGILKTMNGGETWQRVGPGMEVEYTFSLEGMVMNKQNSEEMIAYSTHKLYITKDSWNTFDELDIGLNKEDRNVSICDVEFAPNESGKFYVSTRTYNKYESKVFICTNFGKTITDITPNDVQSERAEVSTIQDPKFTGKFYLALGWNYCYIKYFNGKSFSETLNKQPITQSFGSAYWNFEFSVNQKDTNVMYLSMTETSRSIDGGRTFENISFYNGHNTHADNRAMLLYQSSEKGTNDILYLGNDGGISLITSYDGKNWSNLNGSGLDINQFWGVSVAQSDTTFVTAGCQDNGAFFMLENGMTSLIQHCGDAYLAGVFNNGSALVECNAPTYFFYDKNSKRGSSLSINEDRYELKRPLVNNDSILYVGQINVWKISKDQLKKGTEGFRKVTDIPDIKNVKGELKNGAIKAMAIGPYGSAVISYRDPNWGDVENKGKLLFFSDLLKNEWIDITNDAVCENFAVCQWLEVSAIEMDPNDPEKFYMVSKDIFNQTTSNVYEMYRGADTNRFSIREIGKGLPAVGKNKIKIDKFSNVIYIACDNGVYYANLYEQTFNWKKLNFDKLKLPDVMVYDLDFNYATNTIYAATFARGIWQTQAVSNLSTNLGIGPKFKQNGPMKIDGILMLHRKTNLKITSKFIVTKGSQIILKKGSVLLIPDPSLIRDENNKIIDIVPFVKKAKGSKLVIN